MKLKVKYTADSEEIQTLEVELPMNIMYKKEAAKTLALFELTMKHNNVKIIDVDY